MLKSIYLFLVIFISFKAESQELFQSEFVNDYNFSEKEVANHERSLNLYKMHVNNEINIDSLSDAEQNKIHYIDSFGDDFYQILNGCSWYCGANYTVTCSSNLESIQNHSYKSENVSNFTLRDAWIEGVKGHGIGEYLIFHFIKGHPRITEIFLANGYVRNKALYTDHSRVKEMDLYLNDVLYASLRFTDTYSLQKIILDQPIKFVRDKNELKFVIKNVFKGYKYEQTAISELYFNGLDVH